MRALIQRVSFASVMVADTNIAQINTGILAYIGIGRQDGETQAKKLVDKLLHYRIFANAADKLDLNVQQVTGGMLLVPQFTLMADTNTGRRPDFKPAMPPDKAETLFDFLVDYAQQQYNHVSSGEFGADMQVVAHNEGPINFLLEY